MSREFGKVSRRCKKPKNSWDIKESPNLRMRIKAKKLDKKNIVIRGKIKVYSILYNNHLSCNYDGN